MPWNCVRQSITSSSPRRCSESKSSTPPLTLWASPLRNFSFDFDKPHLRIRFERTEMKSLGKNGREWPSTSNTLEEIASAAFAESCWPIIDRAKTSKGTLSKPRAQGPTDSMKLPRRGSTALRCSTPVRSAWSKKFVLKQKLGQACIASAPALLKSMALSPPPWITPSWSRRSLNISTITGTETELPNCL